MPFDCEKVVFEMCYHYEDKWKVRTNRTRITFVILFKRL